MSPIVLPASVSDFHVAYERALDELRSRAEGTLIGDVETQSERRSLNQRAVRTLRLDEVPEPFRIPSWNI